MYGFVGNDGVNWIDMWGMWKIFDFFKNKQSGTLSIESFKDSLNLVGGVKQVADFIFPPDIATLDYVVESHLGMAKASGEIVDAMPMAGNTDGTEKGLCGCVVVTFEPSLILPVEKLKKKVVDLLRLQRFEKVVQVSAEAGGSFKVADCAFVDSHEKVVFSKDAKITLDSFMYIGLGEKFDDNVKHLRGLRGEFAMEGKIRPDESGLNIEFKVTKPDLERVFVVPIPLVD